MVEEGIVTRKKCDLTLVIAVIACAVLLLALYKAAEKEALNLPADYTESQYGIEMVFVRGGTFMMGCTREQEDDNCLSDESPVHKVTLSDYYIGRYEITQAQWKAVMGEGNNPSAFKGDNLPVERVSWNEIQEFIDKLNESAGKQCYLPTEAEWEYAARGGNQSRGYKYSGSNTAGDIAWHWDNSEHKTHPVGTKEANELGIHDMSGNVLEWVYDRYDMYSDELQKDPQGHTVGRTRSIRGGSWYIPAWGARVSVRDFDDPDARGGNLGFRIACGL